MAVNQMRSKGVRVIDFNLNHQEKVSLLFILGEIFSGRDLNLEYRYRDITTSISAFLQYIIAC